jgi:GDSL-like Lipase/Acylhydrolase family
VISTKRTDGTGPRVPAARSDEHFTERHQTFLRLVHEQPIDVLFLGDSITRRWTDSPGEWKRWFGSFRAANFGVGADCVENLLWRTQNGELEGISPRVIVVLIGTNNIDYTITIRFGVGRRHAGLLEFGRSGHHRRAASQVRSVL